VKLLRDVKVRRQPNELGKMRELDVELVAICHPHKDSFFVVKEESVVELCDDLLVPVVAKLQKMRYAMELIGIQNSVEVHILLALHVVHVYPLLLENWHSLSVGHRVVPVLLKESSKMLIGAPFIG
jgi:hypothetical protein